MLIRTVVLLSLQHKLKQKHANAKNRISVEFINVNKTKIRVYKTLWKFDNIKDYSFCTLCFSI